MTRVAFALLSSLALAATGTAAGESQTHPLERARMYDVSSTELWDAVTALIDELGFATDTVDAEHGVAITRKRRIKRKKMPELAGLAMPDGTRATGFRLHVFVPRSSEPGRLYLGSEVENYRELALNTGGPEAWLFDRLESRLGRAGHAVPATVEGRARLAAELLGRDVDTTCPLAPLGPNELNALVEVGEATQPRQIESTRRYPEFPASARVNRQQGKVIVQGLVQEDGWVTDLVGRRQRGSNPDFLDSAGPVALWRYVPARRGSCALAVHITVMIDFNLR